MIARFSGAEDSCHKVRVEFVAVEKSQTVDFSSEDVLLSASPAALLAAGILPAMRQGLSLKLDAAVDPVFAANLDSIQCLYAEWNDAFGRVNILTGGESPMPLSPKGHRVGLFFSGGVDSFYTLLKHQDEITDLIFVHGFDIRLDDTALYNQAVESIQRVADYFGKRLIRVRTNLRQFIGPHADWGLFAHGAALAAVGHLLSGEFGRIYISASECASEAAPWGSHPVLDPLWSVPGLTFVHDGREETRVGKIRRIAPSDIALKNLRVCWKNPGGVLNCGRCEKCIRTMIALQIAGALERCPVFDAPLSIGRVRKVKIASIDYFLSDLDDLKGLSDRLDGWRLRRALSFAFFRNRLKKKMKKILFTGKGLG